MNKKLSFTVEALQLINKLPNDARNALIYLVERMSDNGHVVLFDAVRQDACVDLRTTPQSFRNSLRDLRNMGFISNNEMDSFVKINNDFIEVMEQDG